MKSMMKKKKKMCLEARLGSKAKPFKGTWGFWRTKRTKIRDYKKNWERKNKRRMQLKSK